MKNIVNLFLSQFPWKKWARATVYTSYELDSDRMNRLSTVE